LKKNPSENSFSRIYEEIIAKSPVDNQQVRLEICQPAVAGAEISEKES
jgi:hypothetical protein